MRRSTWVPRACSSAGDPAVVEITSVTREGIFIGDKLVPAGKPQIPVYAPHAPSATIQGQIIALYGNRAQLAEAGPGAIISINRGKSQGLEIGDVLALYRLGATVGAAEGAKYGWTSKEGSDLKLPNERYGLAFVFRVFDRVSYALVMQASRPVKFQRRCPESLAAGPRGLTGASGRSAPPE